jgi:CBS-domain-containing membrane protein
METHLVVATPDELAGAAGGRMLAAKIGCLPVVDESGRLAGIVHRRGFPALPGSRNAERSCVLPREARGLL